MISRVIDMEKGREMVAAALRANTIEPQVEQPRAPSRVRPTHSPAVIVACAMALMPMTAGLLFYAAMRKSLED